jgi:predicted RNA binding protein YcfA (HicA-like mRNA interferase family)
MSKLPSLTGKEVVFLKHDDGRATVVPIHSGETIGPGLLSKILRDVEMTKDELLKIFE